MNIEKEDSSIDKKFPTDKIMEKFAIKLCSKVMDLSDPVVSYGSMSENSPYEKEIPDSEGEFKKAYLDSINAETFEDRLKGIEKISVVIRKRSLIVPLFQKYVFYRTNPKTIKSLGDQPKPLFIDLSLVEMY